MWRCAALVSLAACGALSGILVHEWLVERLRGDRRELVVCSRLTRELEEQGRLAGGWEASRRLVVFGTGGVGLPWPWHQGEIDEWLTWCGGGGR